MCIVHARDCAGRSGESPTQGRSEPSGGGDEVRPAEDLALSSFGRGARVAWRSRATRLPCDHHHRLV